MASDYRFIEPNAVPGPASRTETVQMAPLGVLARAVDKQATPYGADAVFQYCVGSDASRGALVVIDAGTAKQADTGFTGSVWQVGIAAGALSASNVYGWVQVRGVCDYALGTDTSIAAGAPLYLGSTAGIIESSNSDTSAVGYLVASMYPVVSHSATADEALTVMLNFPQHIGVSANL